jgi:hypothetical protein
MTHAQTVHLRTGADEQRVGGTQLVAAEQTAHTAERCEGGVDAFGDQTGGAAQRPTGKGRVPRRAKGVTPWVPAERGLGHASMVRPAYQGACALPL